MSSDGGEKWTSIQRAATITAIVSFCAATVLFTIAVVLWLRKRALERRLAERRQERRRQERRARGSPKKRGPVLPLIIVQQPGAGLALAKKEGDEGTPDGSGWRIGATPAAADGSADGAPAASAAGAGGSRSRSPSRSPGGRRAAPAMIVLRADATGAWAAAPPSPSRLPL